MLGSGFCCLPWLRGCVRFPDVRSERNLPALRCSQSKTRHDRQIVKPHEEKWCLRSSKFDMHFVERRQWPKMHVLLGIPEPVRNAVQLCRILLLLSPTHSLLKPAVQARLLKGHLIFAALGGARATSERFGIDRGQAVQKRKPFSNDVLAKLSLSPVHVRGIDTRLEFEGRRTILTVSHHPWNVS